MPGDGVTLQTLTLQIESESSNASKGIDSLISTLKKLEKVRSDNLVTVANNLKSLSNVLKGMSMNSVAMLNGLANSLGRIKEVGEVKISSSIGNQINAIKEAIRDMDTSKMSTVGDAFEHFRQIGDITINASLGNNLEKVKKAMEGWNIDSETIDKVVNSILPLSRIGKNSLASFGTNLGKIPEKLKELNEVDLSKAAENIEKILSTLNKYDLPTMANGISRIATSLKTLGSNGTNLGMLAGEQTNSKQSKLRGSLRTFTDIYHLSKVVGGGLRIVGNFIASTTKATSDYVEDLNLFTVSLGEFSEKAREYGERIASIVGINPGQWLKFQGTFMSLATGFGIASEKANVMSQQLTQLGYDLASFYNLDTEEAMRKLQSGISGELEPLRRLGIDLSIARLREDAHRLGIEEKVQSMTQAEKSMLRYNAIIEQTNLAQGDMARTLAAPSNQLRILKAQVTQTAQAIGSIFIPVLNAILPVAIAVVKAVRMVAEAIASLFGYKLPEIDYSGISTAASDVADSVGNTANGLGSAAQNAKKLKDYVLGIDELNIIRPDEGASGGGGGGGGSGSGGTGIDWDIPIKTYDFLNGLIETSVNNIQEKLRPIVDWLIENLDSVLSMAKNIGLAILGWKLSEAFANGLNTLGSFFGLGDGEGLKLTQGVILSISGISMVLDSGFSIGYDLGTGQTISSGDVLESILGLALGGFGGWKIAAAVGGSGPMGLVIGLTITASILGMSIVAGNFQAKVDEAIAERFGDVHLEEWQIDEIVKIKLKEVQLEPLSVALGEFDKSSELYSDLSTTIDTINKYGWKVSVGIELTDEETDAYKTSLQQFVNQAQDYVKQQNYAVLIGIKASFGDSESGNSIYDAFASSGVDITTELTNLGLQLNEVVNSAFSDGILDIDEQKAIADLTEQISHITSVINGASTKADFGVINMRYSLDDMDYESYEKYKEKIYQGLDDAKERVYETEQQTLKGMYAQRDFYEVGSEEWLRLDGEINKYIRENPVKLKIEQLEMEVNTDIWEHLKAAWKTELQEGSNILATVGFPPPDNPDVNVNAFTDWLNLTVAPAVVGAIDSSSLSSEEKVALKRQIEDATPREADLTKELQGYIETGKLVPKSVSDGLHDIKMLKALAGDTTAINYLIGEKLSTDQSFKNMLKTVKGAGAKVPTEVVDGIKSHYQLVKDSSTGMVHIFVDGVEEGVYSDTSTIVENFKAMGINSVDGFGDGLGTFDPDPAVKSMTEDVTDKVEAKKSLYELVAKGLASGYSTELGNIDKDNIAKKMADIPIGETKTRLGWNGKSSSNLDRIAEGSAQGYSTNVSNINSDEIAKKYTGFYDKVDKEKLPDKIKTLASNINNEFKISPSGGTAVDTFLSGVNTSISNANVGKNAYDSFKDYFTWDNGKSLGEKIGKGLKTGIDNKIGNMSFTLQTSNGKVKIVTAYASGGFVDQGEMFIARESGAEMVGRIGSRTAVANNDQIVKGIEGGVSNANARVVDAINTLIQVVADKNVNVNISDTSIGLANERYAASRGEYIDSSAFANTY